MDWFFALPGYAQLAIVGIIIAAGYLAVLISMRVAVVLIDVAMMTMARIAEGVSSAAESGARRVTAVIIALIYLGLCALFKPVRMGFDFIAGWTAHKLEPAPVGPASWGDLVRETDPIAEARNVLGLPQNFSRPDLDSQYRKLMRIGHPDIAGSNWIAQQINEARDKIMTSKGWAK